MNFLRNLKLGAMLGTGFFIVIAIGLAVAIYGRQQLMELTADISELASERMVSVARLQDVKDGVNTQVRVLRNIVLLTDPARIAEERGRIDSARTAIDQTLRDLRASTHQPQAQALLTRIENARADYLPVLENILALATANEREQAAQLITDASRAPQDAYFQAIDEMKSDQQRRASELAATAEHEASADSQAMLVLALASALLGALVAWLITRRVKQQLGGEPAYAAEIAQEVAQGHLSVAVARRPGDDGSVLAAMDAMRARLAQLVGQVRHSSESIATGASQIAIGNADLSQRTEEQASNLEQTAAAMEQMSATVQQNAETVRTATHLANSASATAERGGDVVGSVVRTMEGISQSSRQIADIIGVIDSIAFQTNILALNAAVEAARAGEQGKGFAVVAAEVRTLAQRSAQAAKEIKDLIGESVAKVEAGSQQVGQAGATMGEIVTQVRQVASLITEIGAATHEQSQGISQVSDAVGQLDQVTQQNAALVEESAAAAESLHAQANRLVELISVFRLETASALALPPARSAPHADARGTPGAHGRHGLPATRGATRALPAPAARGGSANVS
ncbi:MAG: Methyl-accepting chemotaxis protein III [Paracidovorax wautersii]|uniref:Methyl-accepting chemotaxis protein III n=1 Tax=Paracidovorax wautersii TaxID=1177982 RepID=A0A7V8FM20_9BURK|nr:MAG: Methyl-accepting chemotaxis protein III [Paracidovorax wautersii]